jgi:hypothetical protein
VLLRRFADAIDAQQMRLTDILDMTIRSDITDTGPSLAGHTALGWAA